MKQFIKAIVITIILALFVFFGAVKTYKAQQKYWASKWNNGICSDCGVGDMIFTGATHIYRSGDKYYYTCNNCGHTVQMNKLMK